MDKEPNGPNADRLKRLIPQTKDKLALQRKTDNPSANTPSNVTGPFCPEYSYFEYGCHRSKRIQLIDKNINPEWGEVIFYYYLCRQRQRRNGG